MSRGLTVLVLLILFWILHRLVPIALRQFEKTIIGRTQSKDSTNETEKRVETLMRLLRRGIYTVLWCVAILMILQQLGVEIGPLLASAGIAGLAVGFGAQNLVRDVISGFFILLENQVRVNDVAIINGTTGLVEKVNFRTIVLRDQAGTVHIFPNGTITSLANMTQDWSAYVFDVGIAYKEDIDRVINLLEEIVKELRNDPLFGKFIVEHIEIFGLDKFDESSMIIKGRIKTLPSQQWVVGREFLKRVKKIFDLEKIEIPFPQRDLHIYQHSNVFQKTISD